MVATHFHPEGKERRHFVTTFRTFPPETTTATQLITNYSLSENNNIKIIRQCQDDLTHNSQKHFTPNAMCPHKMNVLNCFIRINTIFLYH